MRCPAMAAAIFEWSCDLGDDAVTSCDTMTNEHFNQKRGEKSFKGNKWLLCIIREKDEIEIALKHNQMGRGTEPGQN